MKCQIPDALPKIEEENGMVMLQSIFPEADMGNEKASQQMVLNTDMEGLVVSGLSDVGGEYRKHNWNEDSMLVCERGQQQLLSVIDGIGSSGFGYWMGKFVNEALVQTFKESPAFLLSSDSQLQRFFENFQMNLNSSISRQKKKLEESKARIVNQRLYRRFTFKNTRKKKIRDREAAACSCSAFIDSGLGVARIANIGDCKAMVIDKQGEIIYASLMQNVASQDAVKNGVFSQAKYFSNENRNTLTSFIHYGRQPQDIQFELSPTLDTDQIKSVILASDGLWDVASEQEVLKLSQALDGDKLSSALVDLAVSRYNPYVNPRIDCGDEGAIEADFNVSASRDAHGNPIMVGADNVTVQVAEFK